MTKRPDFILLGHGSGGTLMHSLIEEVIVPRLANDTLSRLEDAAETLLDGGIRLAFTTDSYVVSPIMFRGGDIGRLAVAGTVNDLAAKAARPLQISLAFIIEEGFPTDSLVRILESIAVTANEAGVDIVTGDTKVVERGSADGIFINTSGIGIIPNGRTVSPDRIQPGDAVIVSGSLGDHGIAVLADREGIAFDTSVVSDAAPLSDMVERIYQDVDADVIRCLRDPTRGGVATTLNELARHGGVGIEIDETALPVNDDVLGACEMLGLDPLYIANEGKFVIVAAADDADDVLRSLRSHPRGRDAVIIGTCLDHHPGRVTVKTILGTSRILTMLSGEQLPRIC